MNMRKPDVIFVSILLFMFIGVLQAGPLETAADKTEKKGTRIKDIKSGDMYKKIILRLQRENAELKMNLEFLKNLNARLELKAKKLYTNAQYFKQTENELKELDKTMTALNSEYLFLKKENTRLQEQSISRGKNFQEETARLNQELGTAYTQAKLFDRAIDAYLKSLSCNPQNQKVHYNLALLYKHAKNDLEKSEYHFKKYLQSGSSNENRKEAEYLIDMLRAERQGGL